MKQYRVILLTVFTFLTLLSLKAHSEIKIGTYNIRNYDYDERSRIRTNESELFKIIKSTNADLLGVQEVVNGNKFEQFVSSTLPEYAVALTKCGGRNNQKPGVLYKKSVLELISFTEDNRVNDSQGCGTGVRPAAVAQFRHKKLGITFSAIVLHLKAGGAEQNVEQRFHQLGVVTEMIREIRDNEQMNIVVMGDLNTTDYSLRGHGQQRFVQFADVNRLIDFSAQIKCTSYWWGGSDDGLDEGSILDHVLVSKEFAKTFQHFATELHAHCGKNACATLPPQDLGLSYKNVSDHCPVVAVMK